jgi:ribosome-binding ATPase
VEINCQIQTVQLFFKKAEGGVVVKAGLIGLPNSGVTTIFSLFCKRHYQDLAVSVKNEVVFGNITVPDTRVDKLSELTDTEKSVYATIDFADIPMQVEKAVIAPTTINLMRKMDAIVLIVRSFKNPSVPHINETVDPVRDLEFFIQEALLSDLIQVENKLERIEKEGRIKSREGQMFLEIKTQLDNSVPVRDMQLTANVKKETSGFSFLSQKPWLVIVNCDPGDDVPESLHQSLKKYRLASVALPGLFELELEELPESERLEFLQDSGLDKSSRERFINLVYTDFDLISFLTFGKDECRAWSLKRGSTAIEAAGKIHSDLARGFIRAEVITFDDFVNFKGSIPALRKVGKLRVEGKNYIVQDGDLLTVLFNI